MPVYEYVCKKCKITFEEYRSITIGPHKKCPSCGEKNNDLFHTIISAAFFSIKEIKTIGQLAEHNSKKMGKELIDKIERDKRIARIKALPEERQERAMKIFEQNEYLRTQPKEDLLDLTKIKDINKYVLTGDKN